MSLPFFEHFWTSWLHKSTGSLVPSLSHLGNFLNQSFLQGALLPFITQWNSENEPRTQECVSFYKIRASGFLELPGFLPPARCRIWWDRAEVDGRTGKWSKTEDSVQQVLKDSSVTVNRSWKADNREWMAGSGFEVPTHLPHLDSFQDVWDFPIYLSYLWMVVSGFLLRETDLPSPAVHPSHRIAVASTMLSSWAPLRASKPFPSLWHFHRHQTVLHAWGSLFHCFFPHDVFIIVIIVVQLTNSAAAEERNWAWPTAGEEPSTWSRAS